MTTDTLDQPSEAIVLDALRRFMTDSDLSDQRISLLMGVEIETLRRWVTGTSNPRKNSLQKIHSFLQWHGRKNVMAWDRSEAEFLDVASTPQKSG